jgi:hypothetical protein
LFCWDGKQSEKQGFFSGGSGRIETTRAQQGKKIRLSREEVVEGRKNGRNVFYVVRQVGNRNSHLKEGIMRKVLIVLLVAVVAVAFALPAMADMTPTNLKVSGFYRSKAWLSNFFGSSSAVLPTSTSEPTNAFVEQRFRLKFDLGSENVKAVWFLESDLIFGDEAGNTNTGTPALGAKRNSGGALGADRIATETKNLYVWFKVPDTSVDVTVGLQNQSDDYAGFIYGGADMAGIFMTGKYEPVTWKLGWAKLYENQSQRSDDQTLYVAEVKFVPAKNAKIGANFYFFQDDTNKVAGTSPGLVGSLTSLGSAKVYMPGLSAAFTVGPATISGFAQYQFGTFEPVPAGPDVDISAYLVDLRADMNLGPGKFFIEGLYTSGGDLSGNDYEAPITLDTHATSPLGNSSYSRTNMHILLSSPDQISTAQCILGCSGAVAGSDPGNRGRGMWHIAAGYSQKLTPKLSGQVNVGYLSATEMLISDASNRSEDMGTEFNARLDYNLAKGLDVGVIGAYALVGDFFKNPAGQTPEDIFMGIARVNYAF